MAIRRLLMYIQRLQTEILAIILIHFFRVLGWGKKAARGVFLCFFLLFIRLCGGL